MENVKTIKESKEFLDGLKIVSKVSGSVMADGKVDSSDLAKLLPLALEINKLQLAFTGLGLVKDEIMNLSKEELQELVLAGYAVVEAFNEGKKG